MSYCVIPAHEGENRKWKVTYAGKEVIKTDVQEFAVDFAYLMSAARNERLNRLVSKK